MSADGYELPQSVSEPVVLVVHQVIVAAFAILRSRSYDLANAGEDTVTMWLHAVIENELRDSGAIRGFDRWRFESVTRQQEVANYNGRKVRPTPDLVFKPRRDGYSRSFLSSHFGLFVECKPVGPGYPIPSKYCKLGALRFVEGDYAWSMTEGMMVAYVRGGRTIAKHLHPVFRGNPPGLRISGILDVVSGPAAKAGLAYEALHVSEHDRQFDWPHDKGPACRLKLYHSWHVC